ncbi:hypothetical protein AMJ87_11305 [candidate division WOR_3 bacterium SM23_60]|uniref:Uncharacterized protein n=1 Tax=candidate division WOR_3 bacterium SM23_60 TaxID=1703780 RepID=A0A0S8G707_UNCW3|nr:MAG: hypothetical protein AMJ87_11305 [candidate division WOR_3 bacterium SM23_60]
MRVLKPLAVFLCLQGFLPVTIEGAQSALRTQRFHSSYLNVFVSVVHALVEKGYEIDNADELRGVITTKWKEERTGFFSRKDIRRRICASVLQHEDDVTEVGLQCLIEIKEENRWHERTMSRFERRKLYLTLFRSIQRNVYEYNGWY